MTAIDRTAYPRSGERLTREELERRYGLSEADLVFIRGKARGASGRLTLAALLKARQDLGFFPAPDDLHSETIAHLAAQLGLVDPPICVVEDAGEKTLYRYRTAVRAFLDVVTYDERGEDLLTGAITEAASTMSDPADLINLAIEVLGKASIDLPAFSTLDRLANHLRTKVHTTIYTRTAERLGDEDVALLDDLLVVAPGAVTTGFNRLKHAPGPARPETIKHWTERLGWLTGMLDPDPLLNEIAHTKRRQFAAEARSMEVSDLLDIRRPGKRHTLLLCLLQQARAQCRDELIEMLLRRVRKTQNAAKEKLKSLQDEHREIEEKLITVLGQVLDNTRQSETDMEVGRRIRAVLAERGGLDLLSEQCETVSAFHHNNDLPLLWPIHAKVRALLFRLLELMDIRSTTQDLSLLEACGIVIANRSARRDELAYDIDLSFASQRWQAFVIKRRKTGVMLDRRALEVCVFIHLADALQAGDLFVVGAETFNDYRTQLLSWTECEARLADYCADLGLPRSGEEFAAWMKEQLMAATAAVDAGFPENTELSIDASGVPHLKQQKASGQPEGLMIFEAEVHARIRERHLLDILKDSTSWTAFTRHFGPPSGADPKIARALQRYILTVFGYGCNLGPVQTARHAVGIASADTLRRLNAQHIDVGKLEAAMTDLINAYDRFELPKLWGAGQAAIADGTHIPLRENNLLGSQHIRYGAYGGIAYHHIADNYIALFTTFIPCGVWEAIHILDGLLKNRSTVQPDTLHADTQGQSEPVFGLARLLGIKLMPRMRNWADVTFYRPDKSVSYQHIDALFGREIDWRLIETHWQDMMQVILSIQAGLVVPSMLLRKLSSNNRKNRLYQAFRELGRVERTLFLLRYISDPQVRRSIRAETTKIESFNDFLDWITFGGPVIKSGDPVEQEKQVKYASLVANAIMLSNVADLTDVINSMATDGLTVTPELAAALSPYARAKIRRFGKYSIDMEDIPQPLNPAPLPFEVPL
ncbi:TnpA family transposase [Sinorhizobium fredii]|uniref:Tn3 family transposase n=2 Tax=Rhizobium fredii TaxID=380 RepID=UPI0004B9EB0D|nr:Tn3 family transposase [Sinorhizobium fredii]UTY47500.1 Tn3 family transposase [Sinorhizobium fredii]